MAVPAFVLSELNTAFQIGFLIALPFLGFGYGGLVGLDLDEHDYLAAGGDLAAA